MKSLFYILLIVLVIGVATGIYIYGAQNPTIDQIALQIGNVALALISLFSFSLISTSFKSSNSNDLLRAKLSSTMMKFFGVIALVLAYVFYHDRQLPNKSSIFIFLGIYVLYMILESASLSKLSKSSNKK